MAYKTPRLSLAAILVPTATIGLTSPRAIAVPVVQITDNTNDDTAPDICNGAIVWQSWDGSGNRIMLYDATTTTLLSSEASFDDYDPQISGTNVVWQGYCSGVAGSEIFLFDGTTTSQLTEDAFWDTEPQVSGGNVVWRCNYGICLNDGTTTQQISAHGQWPQISGPNIVWLYFYEIWLYNIDTGITTQLTDDGYQDSSPQIRGSNVVWVTKVSSDHSNYEIFYYNIESGTTTRLTDNDVVDRDPQVSDTYVVWYGSDGDNEIFLYDIATSTVTQLTSNAIHDNDPQVWGTNVVWDGWGDVMFYAGTTGTTTQLTFDGMNDQPKVGGSTVAWMGWDGNDYEIFLAEVSTVPDMDDDGDADLQDFAIFQRCFTGADGGPIGGECAAGDLDGDDDIDLADYTTFESGMNGP